MEERHALEDVQRRAAITNLDRLTLQFFCGRAGSRKTGESTFSPGALGDRPHIEANPDVIVLPAAQIVDGRVIVAEEEDGDVSGFAVILPRADGDAELDGLFVEPLRHRRGVGRALVAGAAEKARSQGARALHVVGNPHAEKFYRACGFREIGAAETQFGPGLLLRLDLAATLGEWLRRAAASITQSQSPRLDARLLARFVLGLDDAGLIAGEGRVLSGSDLIALEAALTRRIVGEPIAYITGAKEFWGLPIRCRPPMLLPRPDSETLVTAALERRDRQAPLRLLDLGAGTGCLLAALLSEFHNATGLGVDYNPDAVALVHENLAALGLGSRGTAKIGDWGKGVAGPFDLIVANPPYVPERDRAALAVDIRDYEDPKALFGGGDGLAAYHAILADAPRLLAPDGVLIFEIGAGQRDDVLALATTAFPDAKLSAKADLGGVPRAIVIDRAEKTV